MPFLLPNKQYQSSEVDFDLLVLFIMHFVIANAGFYVCQPSKI